MYRIGIIGTENSHALGFATYFNVTNPGRAKVVGVMGDPESAAIVKENAGVDFIAETPEDFFEKVDAMMVTSRAGSLHKNFIMPFVKKGMPVFIDKPFTSDPKEALELIEEIKRSGSLVMGGSGCKFAKDVVLLKEKVAEWRKNGKFIQASMNFNVMLTSPYDGIYFYAPHLVEMCIEIFGKDIKAIRADRLNNSMTVTVFYQNDMVTLHFTATAPQSTCILYGVDGNFATNIDISQITKEESEWFLKILEEGVQPYSVEDYYIPIKMIDIIEKSSVDGSKLNF